MIARLVACSALLVVVACLTKPERVAPPVEVDAPPDEACKDGPCRAAGGTCGGDGICHIVENEKPKRPRCPTGMRCDVDCIGNDACEMGVDCAGATTCDVRCDSGFGDNACSKGNVDCGMARECTVTCNGRNACKDGGVQCHGAACEVTCSGDMACAGGVVGAGAACALTCCDGACDSGGPYMCTRGPSC